MFQEFTFLIFVTCGAGVKIFKLVSKNSSNTGRVVEVVVVVVAPPQHHQSTTTTAIKIFFYQHLLSLVQIIQTMVANVVLPKNTNPNMNDGKASPQIQSKELNLYESQQSTPYE